MTATSNLVVPVVLWGRRAPTHCISSIYFTRDQKTLITGCNDGQICLWDVEDSLKLTPRCMLFGHTAPVTCLARGDVTSETAYFISASENGEMCLWDLTDGRCLESTKLAYVHTNIHSYCPVGASSVHLFCNGYYAEILVMEASSLEILFTLTSRVNPDWISAIHVLRPAKRQDDVVVGLSVTGTVKVWTLSGSEVKGSEVYEHESKSIRCLNALILTCCAYDQRTVLIVCTKYWQIYDAGDFSLLCSVENRRGERWTGGDFVAADRVLVWSDEGKGYIYKLPSNKLKGKAASCVVESQDFHQQATDGHQPFLYCILALSSSQPLSCPPAMAYFLATRGQFQKLLLRGDSEGQVVIWNIPEVSDKNLEHVQSEQLEKLPVFPPSLCLSLQQAWDLMQPSPPGILDHLDQPVGSAPKLTASIYLPLQGRLVCGREDGSIVIVPGTHTVLLQLLQGKHHQVDDWPILQTLMGHTGRVTCLLYPHHVHSRYDISHLVSGGVDFSICLWDIYTGTLLHTFCVHAGEVTQLLVPPNNCTPRVLQCICTVASDHSVTLIGLRERRCIMLASRHLFPVQAIKWRPLDDFMVVGCTDGTVYVWQMETGHLDRVLHGLVAEEVMSACDEHIVSTGDSLANPAVHFFRGLRHRNLAAIRHAAQRGLHQLAHHPHSSAPEAQETQRSHAYPLMIQGLRTNPKDADSHVLFFDIEALIVQLLSEEYSTLSPASLEPQGQISHGESQKAASLTPHSSSPDTQKKLSEFFGSVKSAAEQMGHKLQEQDKHGLLAKVKESAETVGHRIQAKAESVGFKPVSPELSPRRTSNSSTSEKDKVSVQRPRSGMTMFETSLTMDIAQLLLSLIHSWGLDPDLDHACEAKLGLLRPLCPISFGLLSRGGMMSLFLPTWQRRTPSTQLPDFLRGNLMYGEINANRLPERQVKMAESLSKEMAAQLERTHVFTSRAHWELSTAISTNHLLALIAIANTLMSMNNASFIPEQERRRKMLRKLLRAESKARLEMGGEASADEEAEAFAAQQAQIKQGWSLLATLHCVLLPEQVATLAFKRPQVEMLARRWQDRCLEVREAAQALLLAELRRIGTHGRKALVDSWAPSLPNFPDALPGPASSQPVTPATEVASSGKQEMQQPSRIDNGHDMEEEEEDENVGEDSQTRCKTSSVVEGRRKQATAVVLLGVIGAEFGQDIEPNRRKNADEQQQRKKHVQDGFGLVNYSLARHTSQALMYLLLAPPSNRLPLHTPLRRAAIDLIGRGFTVWEPYVDVSKILLGLLELCCDSDKLVPSVTHGLPLTPAADSCRTARHSLSLIATARPPAFITTMAKEVARFNSLAQNAQTLNINLHASALYRARPEILRVVELLIDKMQTDVADLLIEVMDIVLHCLDHSQLKNKGFSETFPAICRFNMVSYCTQTRRIAVGARNGSLALYELRASKCQIIPAHASFVTSCAFSPDGKYLASYSSGENKLCFWQTATGLFGLGNSQTRCVRTFNTKPLPEAIKTNPLKMARLVWTTNKMVLLMLSDGSEYRFTV